MDLKKTFRLHNKNNIVIIAKTICTLSHYKSRSVELFHITFRLLIQGAEFEFGSGSIARNERQRGS